MTRLRDVLVSLGVVGAGCAHAVPAPPPGAVRVVFIGDSLVSRSDRDHSLLDLVRRALSRMNPAVAFDLVNEGVNGNCIGAIRDRLARDVLPLHPAAVVLYWDSDAADVEDAEASPSRSRALRVAYERDLSAVLATLHEATPHVIVSGPTLLGERPRGLNPKDHVLDAYARINRRVSHVHHATWLDTRHAAFRWLHLYAHDRARAVGQLTEDGEHLNAEGTQLVADQIALAIGRWLGARSDLSAPLREAPEAAERPRID